MPDNHVHSPRRLRRRVVIAATAIAMLATLVFSPPARPAAAAPDATAQPGVGALIYIANQKKGRVDVHDAVLHGPAPRLGILDTTFDNGSHYAIEVGDLNGDLRDEVLVANSGDGDEAGRIDVIDAITSRPVPGLGVLDTTYENSDDNEIEIGDVNGDGRDEILIANAADHPGEHGRIDVLDGNGHNVPGHGIADTTFDDHPANQIAVGDVTGDGRDDVIISNHTNNGRIDVLDTATGLPIPGYGIADTTLDNGDHYQIAVGDVDGDGRDEILVANSGTGDEGGRIDVFDAATHSNIPQYGILDTTYEKQ